MAGADDEVTAMGGRVLIDGQFCSAVGVELGGLVVEVVVVAVVVTVAVAVGCTLLGVTKTNDEAASSCFGSSTERGLIRDASSSIGVLGAS